MKIGELSELLGIPRETLRYYEKKGMISSVRDQDNAYREYSVWNVFNLINCIRLRQFGFTQQESVQIDQDMSLQEIISAFEKREHLYENELCRSQNIYECLKNKRRELQMLSLNLGRYWFESFEECVSYHVVQRNNDEYTFSGKDKRIYRDWIRSLPFADSVVEVSVHSILSDTELHEDVWPIYIPNRYLSILEIEKREDMQIIPAHMGLCTIIDIGKRGEMSGSVFRPLLQELKKTPYELLDGRMYGRLLLRSSKNGELHRYMKIVAPIQLPTQL